MIRCYEHENSLFFEQFSLIRAENFPVPLRREFGCKSLNLRARADVDLPLDRQDPRNSLLFSLLAGNLPQRPVRSGLRPQPSTKLLIILIKQPSSTINFRPEKRRFRAVACSAGWRRDGIAPEEIFPAADAERLVVEFFGASRTFARVTNKERGGTPGGADVADLLSFIGQIRVAGAVRPNRPAVARSAASASWRLAAAGFGR